MVAPPPALPKVGIAFTLEEQPHAKQIAYAPFCSTVGGNFDLLFADGKSVLGRVNGGGN